MLRDRDLVWQHIRVSYDVLLNVILCTIVPIFGDLLRERVSVPEAWLVYMRFTPRTQAAHCRRHKSLITSVLLPHSGITAPMDTQK